MSPQLVKVHSERFFNSDFEGEMNEVIANLQGTLARLLEKHPHVTKWYLSTVQSYDDYETHINGYREETEKEIWVRENQEKSRAIMKDLEEKKLYEKLKQKYEAS